MKPPGILLDRDGTIIHDYHYVGHIHRVQLIDGAADAIAQFNRLGIPVAIVTNQSGVARGFYPLKNVELVHEYIAKELALHGAHIDLFLHSPYHTEGSVHEFTKPSRFHKPEPGMAHLAGHILSIDLKRSIVVGDRWEDMELARRIGAEGVHLGIPLLQYPEVRNFPTLAIAAGYIIERITGMTSNAFPGHKYDNAGEFLGGYVRALRFAIGSINESHFAKAAGILQVAYQSNKRVFIAGNGGSSAIADHFRCDHTKGISNGTWLSPQVFSLTDNVPLITSIGNDIGYDQIFSRQLDLFGAAGDVLVAISASGQSANILRALSFAREHDVHSIFITGDKTHADLTDVTIHIDAGNYGIIEDASQAIMHSLAQYLRQSVMSVDEVGYARF